MNKNILTIIGLCVLTSMLISCGKGSKMDGQLVGSQDRPKWKGNINPYGMVYIKSGTLTIGSDDQDKQHLSFKTKEHLYSGIFYG